MTPVEYARLQGVPDSVEFEHDPSPNQALYALGDAICVPLVQWIAKHAFKHALAEVSHA
jgi:DNA (cytosine-5)-methyltransferase 1